MELTDWRRMIRYVIDEKGQCTTQSQRSAAYFPLIDHLQVMFQHFEEYMCAWFTDPRARPGRAPSAELTDIWDSRAWDEFLETHGNSRYSVALSICIDGVQKSTQTQKTITPIMIKIESLPASVRYKGSFQHCAGIIPPGYSNLDLYLSPLVQELMVYMQTGARVILANNTIVYAKVKMLMAGGDLRALPALIGIWRDPSPRGCPVCQIRGQTLGFTTRYKESKERAAEKDGALSCADDNHGDSFDEVDANGLDFVRPVDGQEFKRCPLIGALMNPISQSAYCFAHGLKNFCVLMFETMSDSGRGKFTAARRQAQRRRFPQLAADMKRSISIHMNMNKHTQCLNLFY